jgi:hypothetical protein
VEVEEAKALVDWTFDPPEIRRPIKVALESAYETAFERMSDYAPWQVGRWVLRQNRKGIVEG